MHAYKDGRRLHVPRILLSASTEFQAAYSKEPQREPALDRISPEDERVQQSPWYRKDMKTPPPEDREWLMFGTSRVYINTS